MVLLFGTSKFHQSHRLKFEKGSRCTSQVRLRAFLNFIRDLGEIVKVRDYPDNV